MESYSTYPYVSGLPHTASCRRDLTSWRVRHNLGFDVPVSCILWNKLSVLGHHSEFGGMRHCSWLRISPAVPKRFSGLSLPHRAHIRRVVGGSCLVYLSPTFRPPPPITCWHCLARNRCGWVRVAVQAGVGAVTLADLCRRPFLLGQRPEARVTQRASVLEAAACLWK